MSPRRRKEIDPLEQAMETALAPGSFISHEDTWSLIEDARSVADDVDKLIESDPERAGRLYETFIAACHEKANEIDDSSGYFGMLVEELFCGWIDACQTAGMDPDEMVKSLLAWMEDDPYGFCHQLHREAVRVLDRERLDAFARQARAKFETAAKPGDDEKERFPDYARRRWGEVLKTILAAQRNIDDYIELCEETDLGPGECEAIADMYRSRRRLADALAWVERGLEIARSADGVSSGGYKLPEMKRELLTKLGRPGDALESAWAEFQKYPSIFSYKELMRYVPVKKRDAWHQKAMEASEDGDLSSQIELWLEKKEIDRLVTRLLKATDEELEDVSHHWTKPAARKLEGSHPEVAARMYRALGMRVVNAGKSKYYDAALDNLERAKKCHEKAGLDADWEALVADVRRLHYRKKGFMAGFEQIISGAPRPAEPDFLERARQRWPRGGKR